jgi:hypothetical protein
MDEQAALFSLVIVAACTLLNRASGDDTWMKPLRLRGRPLWYTAPVLAGYASLLHTWPIWLAFGVTYLVWRVNAWGRWYDLGRMPDGWNRIGVEPSPFERIITAISCGSDHLAFFWRNALMLIPGFILIAWLIGMWSVVPFAFVFALLIVGVYELAWRTRPNNPIIYAELTTGLLWGLLIVSVFYVRPQNIL